MNFNCIGELLDFNPLNKNITIKCNFLTPENLNILEGVIKEQKKALKINFNFSPKKTKQYSQQKFYYWFLNQLLLKYGADLTSENLHTMDEEIRRQVFPCTEVEIDNRILKQPMRMHQLDYDQMQKIIETLKDRYAHLNINYAEIGEI